MNFLVVRYFFIIQLHEAPTAATVDSIPILAHQTRGNFNEISRRKKNETCFATNICGKCFATTFGNEISRTQEEHQDKKVRLKSAKISYTSFRCKWIISE